jgi:predicted RNase H-like nuclease (RuvC/YqgF family)
MDLKMPLNRKQKMQAYTVVEEKAVSIQNSVQEQPFQVLQKLISEEANLMEQKEKLHAQLAALREKQRLKVQRKIRRKENNIQQLKSEIKDLKFYCEELSKSLRDAHTVAPD